MVECERFGEYTDRLRYNGIWILDDLQHIQSQQELMDILDTDNDVQIIFGAESKFTMQFVPIQVQFGRLYDMDEKEEEKAEIYETPQGDDDGMDGRMNMLQVELENYRADYMEQQCKIRNKRKRRIRSESCWFEMGALQIFYDSKAQVIRSWMCLRHQEYQNLLDRLLDKHTDHSLSNRLFDVYPVLFKLIIRCYGVIQREYKLMAFQDPVSINLIFLNMQKLWVATRMVYNGDENKRRMENVGEFIQDKIDEILKKKSGDHEYDEFVNDEDVIMFVIKCCCILWNVVHFGMDLYPKRWANIEGDEMRYCFFPAIINADGEEQTKIYLVCDQF